MDPNQETIDYTAVRRLQDSYADIVTRRAWSELEEIMRPNAPIILDTRTRPLMTFTGPVEIGNFIRDSIAHFSFFEFSILNSHVMLRQDDNANVAAARMYICEIRCDGTTGEWTRAYGIYHDRYERLDGQWWFAARRYHSLAREPESAVFPFPANVPHST
jgi:hypothetical protein